ncbi:hypothetical protein C6497_04430 [Candidatus Poribacteria bacterium]|nr:MAG: hypothetical protein C6497_04430 [Candidatus Poribacteria bacterium]
MKTWIAALIIITIGILIMALGFWLGYRYISEQDDIHHQAENIQFNDEIHGVITYQNSNYSFVII